MRWFVMLAFIALTCDAARSADWPLFGADASRASSTRDGTITPANVTKLRVRWRTSLDDVADSAPIVAGTRLYETSRNGTTDAIDVATGRILWRFATHGPKITTSVPAYDASANVLYVPGVDGAVHKIDPASGRELKTGGFPASITVAPETEKNASPLNLANGYLYAQTSGYIGDATPYVGHVVAIRLRDGAKNVFNSLCASRHALIAPSSCDAQRSGMWSRAGVVVDPDPAMQGRIYAATGNGPFDARAGDYGDSILSLNASGDELIGSLTPDDADELESTDRDVGSSSPALLPRQTDSATPLLAVQGGKDATLRLFDRAHLGRSGKALQTLSLGARLFSAPAVWTDPKGTVFVVVGLADGTTAYRLVTENRTSRLALAWHEDVNGESAGSSPAVDDGVIFVAASGQLVALRADTGERLWSSNALGNVHWESPIVAGNTVYCSDENGSLTAFGLAAQS